MLFLVVPKRVNTNNLSSLEECVRDYLALNSSLVERRQHSTL